MLRSCGTTRNRRSFAGAATALLVLAAAGCGSEDGGSSGAASSTTQAIPATTAAATVTTQPAATSTDPPATYTVVAGDSLSAIADAAGVSLDELVAANGWVEGINHPIFPGDVVLLPAGAAVGGGSAASPASTPPATDADADAASGGYREVGNDRLLSLGPDGATAVVTQPLADGIYFAMQYGLASDGAGIEFTLARFVTADACIAALGTVPDGTVDPFPCLGGVTDDSVTATVTMPRLSEAPIVLVDNEYRDVEVSAAEFARLLAGGAPAPDAPAWFEYEAWPDALVEIRGGAVVRANQRPSS